MDNYNKTTIYQILDISDLELVTIRRENKLDDSLRVTG